MLGKPDLGQGTGAGFRQLTSHELALAFDRTTCIAGSTTAQWIGADRRR